MNTIEEIERVRMQFNEAIDGMLEDLHGEDTPQRSWTQEFGLRRTHGQLRDAVKALGALVRYHTIMNRA